MAVKKFEEADLSEGLRDSATLDLASGKFLGEDSFKSEEFFDFSGLWSSIKRDLWLLVCILTATTVAAAYYAFYVATPVYRTSASLVLKSPDTDVAGLRGERSTPRLSDADLNTQLAVLLSENLLTRVASKLELEKDPDYNPLLDNDLEALTPEQIEMIQRTLPSFLARSLRGSVSARIVPGTYVINTIASSTSPVRAQQIADAMIDAYLELQVEGKVKAAQQTQSFLETRVDQLQNEVLKAEQRIDDFNAGLLDGAEDEKTSLRALTNRARALNEQYEALLSRLTEVYAQEGIYQADASVLSYATVPLVAVAPRKKLIVFYGIVLGGAIGLALIVLRQYMTNRIKSRDALVALTSLPILGVLPKVRFRRGRKVVGHLLSWSSKDFSVGVDSFLGNLLISGTGQNKLQVVTSCNRGDGKSTTTQAMAKAYANRWNKNRNKNKVLLIDADLRGRTLSSKLAPNVHHGLIAVTEGTITLKDAVVHKPDARIDFLACEAPVRQPVDLLYSEAFHGLLEEAKETYDIVVIDTVPILVSSDVFAFCKKCDSLIFLIRANHTTKRLLKLALSELNRNAVKPSGLVVTRTPKRAMQDWEHQDHY